MERATLIKLLMTDDQADFQLVPEAKDLELPLQELLHMDKKFKKLIQQLQIENLVEYKNMRYQLTNMGIFMAKLL
ncbi:hypothetical protein [Geosporobacter ferrireducens]|uniref:Uncharacterized protein n=1 Tax=Geosporobacter ferrireducens TaxID=1424294 RepID=A0A1D8GFM3_9FIRM|nr:hypothetical protein [Geosporobacter ferrireducens]AOT69698.1 hypothetical protein Gferi_08960 [Geosporobacter ferrireducens]MTI54594.1 hypothetical protein [Geosporobacter ferrireducens]